MNNSSFKLSGNTLRLVAFALGYSALSSANAATTICKVSEDSFMVRAISWDSVSGKARVQMTHGEPFDGRVTSVRPHDIGGATGQKVNTVFSPKVEYFGVELEFVVFPTSKTDYRVVGVGYKVVNGLKLLDISLGNNEAVCTTM